MWKWLHRAFVGLLFLVFVAVLAVHVALPANEALYFDVMPPGVSNFVQGFECIRSGSTFLLVQGEVYVMEKHPGDGYWDTYEWMGLVYSDAGCLSRRIFSRDYYCVSIVQFHAGHIAILTAIYPAIFFIRSYRRRRLLRQAMEPCEQCGYDLQGNESGVCPECGEMVKVTA